MDRLGFTRSGQTGYGGPTVSAERLKLC